jgi:hypothetical protein
LGLAAKQNMQGSAATVNNAQGGNCCVLLQLLLNACLLA